MITHTKEIERVRDIHISVESYLSEIGTGHWKDTDQFCVGEESSPKVLWWSRAELLAWPESKAKIMADWKQYGKSQSTLCVTLIDGCASLANENDLRDHAATKAAIARGLCIYREMLTVYRETLTDPDPEPAPVVEFRIDDVDINGSPICSTCSARFKPNGYSSATLCGYCRYTEEMSGAVDNSPAKLPRKESRPSPVKHPHEGRSCRVYRSNDR